MANATPLPPQICGNQWCRRERLCFKAAQGQPRCLVRPPVVVREAPVLQSIGHRVAPLGRPGFADKRGKVEHIKGVGTEVYERIHTKRRPYLLVPAGDDYRVGDAVRVMENGGRRQCMRFISDVETQHDGLSREYVILGFGP